MHDTGHAATSQAVTTQVTHRVTEGQRLTSINLTITLSKIIRGPQRRRIRSQIRVQNAAKFTDAYRA